MNTIANIDTSKVSFAQLGPLSHEVFQRLKEMGVIPDQYKTAEEEYSGFMQPFLADYAENKRSALQHPLRIPDYRKFAIRKLNERGDLHVIHPHGSNAPDAFPDIIQKGLFKKSAIRIAASECCDATVTKDNALLKVLTSDLGIVAAIYDDRQFDGDKYINGALIIQTICKDKEVVSSPSISPGIATPFVLDIKPEKAMVAYFQALRASGGELVRKLLERPHFLAQSSLPSHSGGVG